MYVFQAPEFTPCFLISFIFDLPNQIIKLLALSQRRKTDETDCDFNILLGGPKTIVQKCKRIDHVDTVEPRNNKIQGTNLYIFILSLRGSSAK